MARPRGVLRLGGVVTASFLRWLRSRMHSPKDSGTGVPGWLTGLTERLFFTIVVAFDISGTATAMMGWLGAKMATNWNRTPQPDPAGAISALVTGLISMLFASSEVSSAGRATRDPAVAHLGRCRHA